MNKINSSDLWLVLDIGTTELKGALMNSEGVIQKESSRPNRLIPLLQVSKSRKLKTGGKKHVKFFLN